MEYLRREAAEALLPRGGLTHDSHLGIVAACAAAGRTAGRAASARRDLVDTLTWKSLVLGALRNREVQEMKAFAEDRREEHILEIGRLEAQATLVHHYDSAEQLLRALDKLRSRVAYELQTSGDDGAEAPRWSQTAVGLSPNGQAARPLEYPDGLPPVRRRRSANR